ncbi:MAG: hypothetical protein REH79_01740 [Spiroplasma sp.]|nr:hypothetical protein [Spiroplasma sp.]
MLRRFLLLTVALPTLLGFSSKIIIYQWDLAPKVLLITSYEYAERQSSADQLIYHKLQDVYGDKVVTTVFSHGEDNTYAYILASLITRFNLKKVFILDPAFRNYLPSNSANKVNNSNLIRVLQEFTNVDFYFFNNQIANNVKVVANNIYEFRFDEGNKEQPNPSLTYGASIAEHFVQQLIDSNTGEIAADKYNFDTNDNGQWVIKIGVINNIGNPYQQKVINEFVAALSSISIPKTVWDIKEREFKEFNLNYNFDNIQRIQTAALKFYQDERVNFIFNSNNWFNNAIAYAASHTTQKPEYTKTIKFIANNVFNKNDYQYQNINYMLFSYHLEIDVLKYTEENNIPDQYQVLDTAEENLRAYGLNNNLIFVDGL